MFAKNGDRYLAPMGIFRGDLHLQGGGRWEGFDFGEVVFSKLLDGFHDVEEGQPFFCEAVFDAGRDLEVGLPLYKADFFQHFESLRQRFGTDIANDFH